MIDDRAAKLLWDVRESARAILNIVRGREADDVFADRTLRAACLWEFAVIGEAVNRMKKDVPDVAARISEYDGVIKFRHQLVHGYDTIQDVITWRIIQDKLPVLLAEVVALLAEADDADAPPPP